MNVLDLFHWPDPKHTRKRKPELDAYLSIDLGTVAAGLRDRVSSLDRRADVYRDTGQLEQAEAAELALHQCENALGSLVYFLVSLHESNVGDLDASTYNYLRGLVYDD